MTTLAVKRYKEDMRVIVELNTMESKVWLEAYHLPGVQATTHRATEPPRDRDIDKQTDRHTDQGRQSQRQAD